MESNMLMLAAILVVVVLLTVIGILSRYRKCKSDEVLVVYGKNGTAKSAKLYHGGAAFVWPIVQGYEFLSMKPMQIDCKLTGAISAQNIRVDVPTTITVAISTDPEVMQNAAERMLGLSMEDKQNLITDVVYGQMRLVIADMTIEELNSDRDKFLSKVKDNIDTELRKFGLYLMNINISDIRDAANYIVNLGKEAEQCAERGPGQHRGAGEAGSHQDSRADQGARDPCGRDPQGPGNLDCRHPQGARDLSGADRQGACVAGGQGQCRKRVAGGSGRGREEHQRGAGQHGQGKPYRRAQLRHGNQAGRSPEEGCHRT